MKATNTLITLFIAALNLNAQEVVLTRANVPPNGTIYINYDSDVSSSSFTFSKTGTSNVWDFTGVAAKPGEDDTVYYVTPSLVEGGDNFPAADLVSYENGDKTYSFVKLENNGAYVIGLYGDLAQSGTNFALPFSTPVVAKPFPFSATTQYQGTVLLDTKKSGSEAGFPVDSLWLRLKNTTKINVIASGQIVIPSGTFPAILEMRETVVIDTVRAKFIGSSEWLVARTSIESDTTYSWYTQQSAEEYARVIYKQGQVTDISYHKSTVPLGLNDASNSSITVKCYPNPAKETLNFSMDNEVVETVNVISSDGRGVKCSSSHNSINVSTLQTGIYVAKIQLKDGRIRLSTFVKN